MKPGDTASRSRTVSSQDIVRFTELSGDRNPIHYDEQLAAKTRFGGVVVQGGVTTAILNAVVAEDLPGPGSVFLQLDLRFLSAVHPGDTITGTVEVTSVREDKPITELDVRVERGDGTVVVAGRAVCYTVPLPRGQ
jgi:acyl dehydratase